MINMTDFLLPENMKLLGFDCIENNKAYFVYANDGTKHRNPDYNKTCPEPKGKVVMRVNTSYMTSKDENIAYIGISQDGDTRTVYHGLCPNKEFLELLLNNIR